MHDSSCHLIFLYPSILRYSPILAFQSLFTPFYPSLLNFTFLIVFYLSLLHFPYPSLLYLSLPIFSCLSLPS
jgi:hypothetical protein